MSKLLFLPLRVGAGVLAGVLGKTLFRTMWSLIDDEGALFCALRGLADHGSRRVFAGLTGSWPGEEEPKPE